MKTRGKHLVGKLLVSALAICPFAVQAAGATPTTTTLSVTGKVARGQTIQITVKLVGTHPVYLSGQGICNLYLPNSIAVFDGQTGIGSTAATDLNTPDLTIKTGAPIQPNCGSTFSAFGNTTTYSFKYVIPSNANAVNLYATFSPTDAYTLPSQSAVYSVRLGAPVAGALQLLLED
jgi:hypothetical protein